jgi:hypothetical protein
LEAKPPRDGSAATQSVGWVIWRQGPGRGYLALESDLPAIADALEALWSLRAEQHDIPALPGVKGVPAVPGVKGAPAVPGAKRGPAVPVPKGIHALPGARGATR